MIEEIAPILKKVESVHITLKQEGEVVTAIVNVTGGGSDEEFPPLLLKGKSEAVDLQLGLSLLEMGSEVSSFISNMDEIRKGLASKIEEAKAKETSKPAVKKTAKKKTVKKKAKKEELEVITHELKSRPATNTSKKEEPKEDDMFDNL